MSVATAPTPDPRPPTPDAERVITYAEALNEALREEMRRDATVFVIGEDVAVCGGGGIFGVTKGLVEEFGSERIRDTPISEEAIAAVAIGAAATARPSKRGSATAPVSKSSPLLPPPMPRVS